jgi:hypothetical protein
MKSSIIWAVRCAAAAVMFITGAALLVMVAFKFSGVVVAISLLWLFGGAFSFPRMPNAWRRDRPTEKQVAYALKLGIDVNDELTKGELSEMITNAVGR